MTVPKLTVITATYNDELYIREAVESILNQTFADFEYFIVDDGSTDNTFIILTSIHDKRIKLIRNESKTGPAAARNLALTKAKGEFIAIMDGDDISQPDRFKIQMDYFKNHPNVDYLGTGVRIVTKEGNKYLRDEIKPLSNGAICWMMLHKSPIVHATSIVRKELIETVGYYDESLKRGEDIDLMRKISKIGRLANVPNILYTYRVRGGIEQSQIFSFGKPFLQHIHTTYMEDLLGYAFNKEILNFLWSMRYPLQDKLSECGDDHLLFDAVTALFFLYNAFQSRYELTPDDQKYIHEDLLIWTSKIASKSKNYSKLIDIFLRSENLTNLSPSSTLIKAWVKSIISM